MITNRSALATTPAKRLALDCIVEGITASHPNTVINRAVSLDGSILSIAGHTVDLSDYEEVLVVGAGKASGTMAQALEAILGDTIDAGEVICPTTVETASIDISLGTHPLPSEQNVTATQSILARVREAGENTLVLVLISGGGSALLTAPAAGISLADVSEITENLLESGAPIDAINAVRKHLSDIKGGKLAAEATPATVVGLVMSDVVGDDLSVIASGPTVPDESTFADVRHCFATYGIDVPDVIQERIAAGERGDIADTPGSASAVFNRVTNILVADSGTPLRAAAAFVQDRGYNPLLLSSRIEGESREAAKSLVAIGAEIQQTGRPVAPPAVVLTGGETTVTIAGDGSGGPNQEFALSAAVDMPPGITVAAVDTDGIDGATTTAGGLVDYETVTDRRAAIEALRNNNSNPYLDARNAAIDTGPTGTNVNDFRVLVVHQSD